MYKSRLNDLNFRYHSSQLGTYLRKFSCQFSTSVQQTFIKISSLLKIEAFFSYYRGYKAIRLFFCID